MQHRASLWRSLDEHTAARAHPHDEFAPAVLDPPHGVQRREFLQAMGASIAMAGLAGCSRRTPREVVPIVGGDAPQGVPTHYATSLTRGGFALGVIVTSVSGRPIKVEGNNDHPASLGATDPFAQAELLSLYDPGRSDSVLRSGQPAAWEDFLAELGRRDGRGLRLLTGATTSPTLLRQVRELLAALPDAQWHVHEPIDTTSSQLGAEIAFGAPLDAVYRFDRAGVVASFDADFLYALPGSVAHARQFASGRRVRREDITSPPLSMARAPEHITSTCAIRPKILAGRCRR